MVPASTIGTCGQFQHYILISGGVEELYQVSLVKLLGTITTNKKKLRA
jgi:hypothetical protein